jgi:hypothetical protein
VKSKVPFSNDNLTFLNFVKPLVTDRLKEEIVTFEKLHGGKNGAVFGIQCRSGLKLVAKFYHQHKEDNRDRLKTEFEAFSFIRKQGAHSVPEPLLFSKKENCALYSGIEGTSIAAESVSKAELNQVLSFIDDLRSFALTPDAESINSASEACFNFESIEGVIRKRIWALEKSDDQALIAFIQEELVPFYEMVMGDVSGIAQAEKIRWSERNRTLSPSDFGFHNILIDQKRLVFIDFEYFGWDDPAKMINDFLLHPGNQFESTLKKFFFQRCLEIFADDPHLELRTRLTYVLHGINWCLRMLNEFIDHHSTRRKFSLGGTFDSTSIKNKQLLKSKALLLQLKNNSLEFSYG